MRDARPRFLLLLMLLLLLTTPYARSQADLATLLALQQILGELEKAVNTAIATANTGAEDRLQSAAGKIKTLLDQVNSEINRWS